jgi:hypothetical protein
MNARPLTLLDRLASFLRFLFWALLVGALVVAFFSRGSVEAERAAALERFQSSRQSRAIALIHRQDRLNFLGIPIASYISIDDSEAVLRAIRLTPQDKPIDLILHTPGGLVLASEQIARALLEHKGKVTVFVPHYAMSGGTLIALAADEIVMDPNAVLHRLLLRRLDDGCRRCIADLWVDRAEPPVRRHADPRRHLAQGTGTGACIRNRAAVPIEAGPAGKGDGDRAGPHRRSLDARLPITTRLARELGLKIDTAMPREVYSLMDLYPQASGKRPTVLYVEPPGGVPDTGGRGAPAQPGAH